MKAKYKAGDLVRPFISKRMGIVVSVLNGLSRVYWPHKGTISETRDKWLIPFGEAQNGL